jgi:hypothetical protein
LLRLLRRFCVCHGTPHGPADRSAASPVHSNFRHHVSDFDFPSKALSYKTGSAGLSTQNRQAAFWAGMTYTIYRGSMYRLKEHQAQWGERAPSREEVLAAQDSSCLGIDGVCCPRSFVRTCKDGWMTVVVVEGGKFRALCRSCFAKWNGSDRSRKIKRTWKRKKAQLSLPIK